jgi:hypothetical protein
MTPSRETNSSTLTFLMTEFLRVLSDFSALSAAPVHRRLAAGVSSLEQSSATSIDRVRRASNLVLRFPLDIQVTTMFT